MIKVDPSRFRMPPYAHQLIGTEAVVNHQYFALCDEMGNGKTKQLIDAACVLWENQVIQNVIVVCPAQVKTVWADEDFGQIVEHTFVLSYVIKFEDKQQYILDDHYLNWVIASYEYLRKDDDLKRLANLIRGKKNMLIMDESIALANPKSIQARQIWKLTKLCERRYIANGTPDPEGLIQLYNQFKMLSPEILQCNSWGHFRARYAIMGGFKNKQIVGYHDAEEVARLTAPYLLRRLKDDCLDLPDKMPPTHLDVPLTEKNWKQYQSMRDEMVVWLEHASASMTAHAPVKSMRLSQITSGFLGGIQDLDEEEWGLLAEDFANEAIPAELLGSKRTEEIGTEKLMAVIARLEENFDWDPNYRGLIWVRFRPELERLREKITATFPKCRVVCVRGGQKKSERDEAVREGLQGKGPGIMLGNQHAGGLGLSLVTYADVIRNSYDHSLRAWLQSDDRVHRPGQKKTVNFTDIIATGPKNQKTIDHQIIKAIRKKENISNWTSQKWREILLEE